MIAGLEQQVNKKGDKDKESWVSSSVYMPLFILTWGYTLVNKHSDPRSSIPSHARSNVDPE